MVNGCNRPRGLGDRGDALTAFPALYRLAEQERFRLHIANQQLRTLWAGPDVELLEQRPEGGRCVNIQDIYKYFSQSGLHMTQAWFWKLGLPVPPEPKAVPLRFVRRFDIAIDVYLSPASHSDAGTGLKQLAYSKWNDVIDGLLNAGLSVAVGGLFSSGKDPVFWGDRAVRMLDSFPLSELLPIIDATRCVITADNGIGHVAFFLTKPHVHVIPRHPNLSCEGWVSNRNANAIIVYETFSELSTQTVLDSVNTVLALPQPIYVAQEPAIDVAAAAKSRELYHSFANLFNREAAPVMLEHRPDFHKDFGRAS